jgi:3',5'-cyclic-AMP phosphodiesterase
MSVCVSNVEMTETIAFSRQRSWYPRTMIISQLSDIHINEHDSQNQHRLRAIVGELAKIRPAYDLLLLTGDLTEHGSKAEYEILRNELRDVGPFALLPGNHDDPQLLARLFPERAPPLGGVLLVSLEEINVILLDSCVPGQAHGELSDQQYNELAATLEKHQRPTLLALHHPPIDSGTRVLQNIGLHDHARLQTLVQNHAHVKTIVAGHYHKCQFAKIGGDSGCTVVVAPSVAPALVIDFLITEFQTIAGPVGGLLHHWVNGVLSSSLLMVHAPVTVATAT